MLKKFLTLLIAVWLVKVIESSDGKYFWVAQKFDDSGWMLKHVDVPRSYPSKEAAIAGWEAYRVKNGIEESEVQFIRIEEEPK